MCCRPWHGRQHYKFSSFLNVRPTLFMSACSATTGSVPSSWLAVLQSNPIQSNAVCVRVRACARACVRVRVRVRVRVLCARGHGCAGAGVPRRAGPCRAACAICPSAPTVLPKRTRSGYGEHRGTAHSAARLSHT